MKKPKEIAALEVGDLTLAVCEVESTLSRFVSKLQNGQAIEGESIPNILSLMGDLFRLAEIASASGRLLGVRIGYINNAAELRALRAKKAE